MPHTLHADRFAPALVHNQQLTRDINALPRTTSQGCARGSGSVPATANSVSFFCINIGVYKKYTKRDELDAAIDSYDAVVVLLTET